MALLKSAAQITPKLIPITIYLSSLLNFGVTAGGGWPLAGGQITQESIPVMIYLPSLKNFVVTTTGDPLPTGGSADLKSNGIIGISGPNKPKIDAHNDISVISFKFWCDGGRRVTPGRRAGRRIKNLIVLLKLVPETYEWIWPGLAVFTQQLNPFFFVNL